MAVSNRSVPDASVVPVLAYPNVPEAAEWLCATFGLRVRLRIVDHRMQLAYGNGAVIVVRGDAVPAGHSVHVRVEDASAHHRHAAAAGAEIVSPPTDYAYGERQYTARDPIGRSWTFSESIADVDPAEWGGDLVLEER